MGLQGVGRLDVLGVPQFTRVDIAIANKQSGPGKNYASQKLPRVASALAVNQSNVGPRSPRPLPPPPSCQLPLPPHRLPARRGIITAH